RLSSSANWKGRPSASFTRLELGMSSTIPSGLVPHTDSSCGRTSASAPPAPCIRENKTMSESVFLIALVIVGATLVLIAGAIAGAIRGRGSVPAQLNDQ